MDKTNEMLYQAHRCLYFNERTIEQCDTWLSAEEGNEYLIQRIQKRKKTNKNYESKVHS